MLRIVSSSGFCATIVTAFVWAPRRKISTQDINVDVAVAAAMPALAHRDNRRPIRRCEPRHHRFDRRPRILIVVGEVVTAHIYARQARDQLMPHDESVLRPLLRALANAEKTQRECVAGVLMGPDEFPGNLALARLRPRQPAVLNSLFRLSRRRLPNRRKRLRLGRLHCGRG